MKNYSVRTLMVTLPMNPSDSIVIELPDNAIPMSLEIRPMSMPQGLFLHHLIPCDGEGNLIEEIPPYIFGVAWGELYKRFGERMQSEEVNLMESVIKSILLDRESEIETREEAKKETE